MTEQSTNLPPLSEREARKQRVQNASRGSLYVPQRGDLDSIGQNRVISKLPVTTPNKKH